LRRKFVETATSLAEHDDKLVLLFGDISVFAFRDFAARFPSQFFNVGICENTLVSLGAGLSSQGYHPIVHTIAPFVTERCFEQIKLDMCYNGYGGNIVSVGGSFDYAWDGATHHCYTDLALLRMLPTMEVMQPGTKDEFDTLLRSQYCNGKPSYLRISADEHEETFPVSFGQGVTVRDEGAPVTIMTAGPILGNVLKACSDLHVNVVYFHTIKPIDRQLISRFQHTRILVVHDAFGLYEAIAESPGLNLKYHGLPDEFCCYYGTLQDIRRDVDLHPEGIRHAVTTHFERKAA